MAPEVGGTSYGNSYGTRQWAQGTYTNDLVNLNSSYFYNAVHENVVTYCFVYVYNSKGSSITGAYLGIGSDDGCKVWWNGTVVGSDIVGRGVAADSDFWGPVTINAGWNRLLVKVENGTTGHGLYARFSNANRTALTDKAYLAFYTTDSTAPSEPAGLAVAGVASGVWQNTVAAPTFTWTSGADSQGSGEGVSGLRGQKYYFGGDMDGSPNSFQTGTSYAPGAQADGARFFKVATVDYALNESSAASFAFMYDGTAPNPITGLGSSSPGSSDSDWYNSVADVTWTWTAATDATSGLDGYAIAQDTSPTTDPGTTKTHEGVASYTLTGPQNSGEYWLHVRSKDVAGNWLASGDTSHRRIRIDRTSPTGVGMSFGAVTTDSITVTGLGTDVHSGINATTGYNFSRTGASDSGAKSESHTWTGLEANTAYTGLRVTVSDQAVPTPNTAGSAPQTQWTLSVAPAAGSVVADNPSPAYGSTNFWTAVGGFGAGKVQYYRYAFDQSPTHTWTDTEAQWTSGTLATVAASAGVWSLHVKGFNGADAGNGTYDYSLSITGAATATLLVSSANPSALGANVTFTATVSSGAGTPTGNVVFLASNVPFSTNALLGGVAAAGTAALPPGTNVVAAQYAAQGNYLGSGSSLDQVIQILAPCSQTNAIVSITDNRDGTVSITFQGTPQAQYYVVGSSEASGPVSWSAVPGSTNTAGNDGGFWSAIVTNAEPQRFYRSAAVTPCP
jgi:hypothetical protein